MTDELLDTVKAALDVIARCRKAGSRSFPKTGGVVIYSSDAAGEQAAIDIIDNAAALVTRCEQAEAALAALRQRWDDLIEQHDITLRRVSVLDEEVDAAEKELTALWRRLDIQVKDCLAAVEECRALRERHAAEVEKAFREGRHTDRLAGDTEAWLASEAKKELT
jgi:serine phosphatase RsbU (regulator of sigma subunit)